MFVGYKLDYYIICVFLSNVVTKGMRDYKNKNNINNNK